MNGEPQSCASEEAAPIGQQPSAHMVALMADIASQEDEVRRLRALKQEREALLTTIRKLKVMVQSDEQDARVGDDDGSLGADVQDLLASITQHAAAVVAAQQPPSSSDALSKDSTQNIDANIQQLLEEEEAERRGKMKAIRAAKAKKKQQRSAKQSAKHSPPPVDGNEADRVARPRGREKKERGHNVISNVPLTRASKACKAYGAHADRQEPCGASHAGEQPLLVEREGGATRASVDCASTFEALEIFAASLEQYKVASSAAESEPPPPPWLNDTDTDEPVCTVPMGEVGEQAQHEHFYEDDFELETE